MEDIVEAIENDNNTIGLYLDYRKASNTVNHTILVKKIDYYGIRGWRINGFKVI